MFKTEELTLCGHIMFLIERNCGPFTGHFESFGMECDIS